MVKISIIVPVYNVEKYLHECLDSLLNQNLSTDEYEIILIDDGSTDSSLAICREYENRHQSISVYTQLNQGASVARTKGLELAKGEYLFFVDSDDYIASNVLKRLYEKAHENECDILFFNFTIVTENAMRLCETFLGFNRETIYDGEYLAINIDDFGSLWKCLYKRHLVKENQINFTSGIIHEDSDFNIKIYSLSRRIMITDETIYYYRRVGESSTRTNDFNKLQLNLFSDFVVAKNIQDFISLHTLSKDLSSHYSRLGVSLLLSSIIQLLRKRKFYGREFTFKCIQYSFDNKLLPITSRTNSWKTTLLIPIINICSCFYRN